MHTTGVLDMNEVKRLKEKINTIKEQILEGVKIRARIKDQIGEKASSTLLGKQSTNKQKPLITQINIEKTLGEYESDMILNNQEDISKYVTNYHRNMYSKTSTDEPMQQWFLSFIKTTISVDDNDELTQIITEDELFRILKTFSLNKSPGLDGLPIEFYLKFYVTMKPELCQIFNNSMSFKNLTDSQRRAIIILLYKAGDIHHVSSWRPISLICVDCKIIAKVISSRLKGVLNKCISSEQFCCGDKSIVECNNTTRDLLYYCNENHLTGAMINIDLKKAFDSVDHDFLFKIMKKMGFTQLFTN